MTPAEVKLPSWGRNTTGPEKATSPAASLTVTTGAYPCPIRWTVVPSTLSGWFTSMVLRYGVAPGRSVTRVSSSNRRAAPVCTGPVSKATRNCSTPIVNGCSWSSENQAPVVRSSYWVMLLANPWPTMTTLVPRKP